MTDAHIYVTVAGIFLLIVALAIRFYRAYVITKNELMIAETGMALVAAAPSEIAAAEQALASVEKAGEEKMNLCIDALMLLVPSKLTDVFGREVVRDIVQKAFDAADDYAKVAAEKAAQKLAKKKKK